MLVFRDSTVRLIHMQHTPRTYTPSTHTHTHLHTTFTSALVYMHTSQDFAETLDEQLQTSSTPGPSTVRATTTVGHGLSQKELNLLNEQQLLQLFELFKETKKPTEPNR